MLRVMQFLIGFLFFFVLLLVGVPPTISPLLVLVAATWWEMERRSVERGDRVDHWTLVTMMVGCQISAAIFWQWKP